MSAQQSKRRRARPRRVLRERCAGTGKIRYSTQGAVEQTIAILASLGVVGRRGYICPFCGGWHITAQPKKHREK